MDKEWENSGEYFEKLCVGLYEMPYETKKEEDTCNNDNKSLDD